MSTFNPIIPKEIITCNRVYKETLAYKLATSLILTELNYPSYSI